MGGGGGGGGGEGLEQTPRTGKPTLDPPMYKGLISQEIELQIKDRHAYHRG